MNPEVYVTKSREFDREIKETQNAATYALTVEEKLINIKRVQTLREQKSELRREYIAKKC